MLRLIGDVHGHHRNYVELTKGCEYSLQVGDMGFSYDSLKEVDPLRHKFIGGNHDNYDIIESVEHNLGSFGVWSIPEFGDIFYIRGGWSIDWEMRTAGVDWWPKSEELSPRQCEEALKLYAFVRPRLLVSHECPLSIVQYVTDGRVAASYGHATSVIKTRTNQLLEACTEVHRPEMHVFGHFHNDVEKVVEGTRYICLSELESLDLPKGFLL